MKWVIMWTNSFFVINQGRKWIFLCKHLGSRLYVKLVSHTSYLKHSVSLFWFHAHHYPFRPFMYVSDTLILRWRCPLGNEHCAGWTFRVSMKLVVKWGRLALDSNHICQFQNLDNYLTLQSHSFSNCKVGYTFSSLAKGYFDS